MVSPYTPPPLRVAAVGFLNATILTHHLPWPVTPLLPAQMQGAALAQFDLILAPVALTLREPDWQGLAGAPCIGCRGAVGTVRIDFAPGYALETVRTIACSATSQTSNLLLRVLLSDYWRRKDITVVAADQSNADARLIIGDEAFFTPPSLLSVDLGEVWWRWQQLPFIFAQWMSRTPLGDVIPLLLQNTCTSNLRQLDAIAAAHALDPALLRTYCTERICYQHGPEQDAGLAKFFALARV